MTDPDPETTRTDTSSEDPTPRDTTAEDPTPEDAPAFEIDLDPEDQGTAEAGAEPSG